MKRAGYAAVVFAAMAAVAMVVRIDAQGPGGLRQTAYIKASNPHMGDHFGNGGTLLGDSVALSGNGLTLAVGAPNESSGARGANGDQNDTSVYSAGAVYVFTRPNVTGAWTQQAYVKPSNPQPGAEFGHVVTLSADGSTMAVSAYFEASATKGINGNQNDDSIPQAGAVYVFTRRRPTSRPRTRARRAPTATSATAISSASPCRSATTATRWPSAPTRKTATRRGSTAIRTTTRCSRPAPRTSSCAAEPPGRSRRT